MCDNSMINESCYGGVPGKTTLDPVFIREMEYEISRLIRHPLIHFDNDALSCYDRIPCWLANVTSRKYGMNAKVCVVQGMTLRQAKYYLKTKFGLSEEYVSHTQEMPWFGTGQGSGNSPMYWLVISSTLFDIYQQKCTGGATYQSADKSMTLHLRQLGFVDDVMNRTNWSWDVEDPQEVLEDLLAQASRDSQLWKDLLESTNQALAPDKCKYHLIHYDFKENGAPQVSTEAHPPAPLQVQSTSGETVTVKHVPNNKPLKYLGFLKCIDNQKKQRTVLTEKANDYARVVNCSPLSKRGAHIFYRGIYKLSIDYVLPLTYFTEKELEQVQKQAHVAFVTKCGYNRRSKKAMLYGPAHLGGAEFFHLYDLQGFGQVSMFLKYWRTPMSQAGRMIRIVMSWVQYCAGVGFQVLSDPTIELPHLEAKWITSMRAFMATIHATIELKDAPMPKLQRVGDSYIMDRVLANGRFKPSQIKAVNWCRMYLGVVSVSDITNAAGTELLPGMYNGELDSVPNTNQWHQVHQKKPGKDSWKQWRRACRLVAHQGKKLYTTLGDWTIPAAELRRQWTHWHDPDTNLLYVLDEDETFTAHQQLVRDHDKDSLRVGEALPPVAKPVDVKDRTHTYEVQFNQHSWKLPPDLPPLPWSMTLFVEELPSWERDLLSGLELLVPQVDFINKLVAASVKLAADGSVQGPRASFGWVLSDKEGHRLARCNGPAYGANPTSYRAEAYGILSVLRFFYHLKMKWQVTNKFNLVCDNKTMVNRTNQNKKVEMATPNSTLESEWDLLAEIWTTLQSLDDCEIQWIKGHQDKEKPYQDLSLSAQLNVDADALANEYITANPDHPYHVVPLLPTCGCQFHLPIGTITHKLKKEIRLARTQPAMKDHLMDRFGWDYPTLQDVDWESFRIAMRRLDKHRVTLTKHVNNYAPVGTRVVRYDPKYPESCSTCGDESENAAHLMLCPNRSQWRKKCLQSTRKHFEKDKGKWEAPLELIELLLEGIKSVFEDRDPTTIHCAQSVEHIRDAQSRIGWEQLFRGRLSKEWMSYQQHYLGDKADQKINGQTWSTSIAQLLLQQWLNLWLERNGDRHGRDKQSRDDAARRQAQREVTQLYEYRGSIRDCHNWILSTPLEQQLEKRTYVMRAWISSYGPILRESHEHQTRLETG